MSYHQQITNLWYQRKKRLAWVLFPLACCYAFAAYVRRLYLTQFIQWTAPVPVVVVGNITVGGVGKTPLVIAIAQHCLEQGWRVGVVSRGYGGLCRQFPHHVLPQDDPVQVGDEPLLMAKTLPSPVVIAPNRVDAVQYLLKHHQVNLVISDDGLQHYALGRTIEIAVIDGTRHIGNGLRCPAGPLRESVRRLQEVDFCIVNEGSFKQISIPHLFHMALEPMAFESLKTGTRTPISLFGHKTITAVAGIGSPERFFMTLRRLGLSFKSHAFPDHHLFIESDFDNIQGPVVMTEKDAVKCRSFAKDDWYSLCINTQVDVAFWQRFDQRLIDNTRNLG